MTWAPPMEWPIRKRGTSEGSIVCRKEVMSLMTRWVEPQRPRWDRSVTDRPHPLHSPVGSVSNQHLEDRTHIFFLSLFSFFFFGSRPVIERRGKPDVLDCTHLWSKALTSIPRDANVGNKTPYVLPCVLNAD